MSPDSSIGLLNGMPNVTNSHELPTWKKIREVHEKFLARYKIS
jgi:hypothetical protein